MNILIVGNGFDLAHGLKTGYNDFLRIVHEYGHSKHMLVDDSEKETLHFCFTEEKHVKECSGPAVLTIWGGGSSDR